MDESGWGLSVTQEEEAAQQLTHITRPLHPTPIPHLQPSNKQHHHTKGPQEHAMTRPPVFHLRRTFSSLRSSSPTMPSSSSASSSSPSILALAAMSAVTSEGVLHKLQGAQLFVGSAVAFLWSAHRLQVGRWVCGWVG